MPAFRHKVLHILRDAQENFEQLERESPTELQGLGSSTAVGAWTSLTLAEALESNAAGYTPAVRTEQGGADARLRGILKVKAGKELKSTEAIATLAAGFRPSKTVVLIAILPVAVAATYVQIESSGVAKCVNNLAAGVELALDGLTFSVI